MRFIISKKRKGPRTYPKKKKAKRAFKPKVYNFKYPKKQWTSRITLREQDRGAQIFDKEQVIKFDKDGANVDAIIEDNKKFYKVNLKFQDQKLKVAKCSCKDSNKKKYCPHIAAALFAVANEFEDRETRQSREVKESIKRTIDKLPVKTLRRYVNLFAKRDAEIADKIFFAPESGDTNLKLKEVETRFKSLEEKIIDLSKDVLAFDDDPEEYSANGDETFSFDAPEGYDYREDFKEVFRLRGRKISEELSRTLSGIRDNIMGRHDFREALFNIRHVIDALDENEEVYSNDYTLNFVDTIADFWYDLIASTKDKTFREELIETLKKDLEGDRSRFFYRVRVANGALTKLATSERKKRQETEKRQKLVFVPDVFPEFKYNPVLNARERLYAMWGNDYPPEEIESYKEPYRRYPPILEFEDDYYSGRGEYDKAIAAIETVLSYKDLTPEELAPYYLRLARVYKTKKEPEEEKKALINHIESIEQTDLTQINTVKSLMSEEEWVAFLEDIDRYTSKLTYFDLLKQEELKERLFQELKYYDGFVDLSSYDAYLIDDYGTALELKRVKQFKDRIEKLKGRESYVQLIESLGWLDVFPKGKEDIREVVSYWRENFDRKNVLMEELKKAGY